MLSLTTAEAVAASATLAPGAVILAAYLADRVGWRLAPWPLLAVGVMATGLLLLLSRRREAPRGGDTFAFLALTTATLAWLLWLSWPDLLPLGRGPDLTHHLLLIDYIERHWTLVHDRAAGLYLGEMAVYTPGSHILVALTGAWAGTTGAHALHTVMASAVALKVGLVYLIIVNALPPRLPRVPLAAIGAVAHFAVPTFFLGSFTDFSFAAQVISEWFAVAMWWTIACWIERREAGWLVLAGIAGATAFLTWPVVVGPPLALLGLAVVFPAVAGARARAMSALLVIVPVASIAVLFAAGRTDMAIIVGTGGTTGRPTLAAYGVPFLALSGIGLLGSAFMSRARPIAGFALAIALQGMALWAFAAWHGNTPYMALKMAYLALSVQAAGIGVAAGMVWDLLQRLRAGRIDLSDYAVPAAWLALVSTMIAVGRPLFTSRVVPAHPRTMSQPLEAAGLWARANVPAGCVEYLVRDPDTAYWLHLAVLGNPRMTARTGDDSTYELTASLVRWLTPNGRPYAIADLTAIPRDVGNELDIVQPFGTAVVARRRGPSRCDEAP